MSEETIINQTVANEKQQPKKVEDTTVKEAKNMAATTPKPEKKDTSAKRTIGAVSMAGAAGAVVGLLTPVQLFPQPSEVEEDIVDTENGVIPDTSSNNGHLVGHEMEIAASVDDSMSFSQAFAAARREVGSGGLFTWHGHTYGTYYADEWNAMSDADKEQYWANVQNTTAHLNESTSSDVNQTEEPELAEQSEGTEADEALAEAESVEPLEETEADEALAEAESVEPLEGTEADEALAEAESVEPLEGTEADEALAEAESVEPLEETEADEALAEAESVEPLEEMIPTDLIAENGAEESGLDESLSTPTEEMAESGVIGHPDLDLLASNFNDSDIPIDNHMDMSDFV